MGCETTVKTTIHWTCDFCGAEELAQMSHAQGIGIPSRPFYWVEIRHCATNDPDDPPERLACHNCFETIQTALAVLSKTPKSYVRGED